MRDSHIGFKIEALHDAQIGRFAVRLDKNFSARRNVLPASCGMGCPPECGKIGRPLGCSYDGRWIEAAPPITSKPGKSKVSPSVPRSGMTWC